MTEMYIDIIIGILALGLGYATIKNKLGRYIIFVDEKKYDIDKVSKKAGSYIMAYGVINIFLVVARYLTKGTEIGSALDKAGLGVIIAIGFLIYYDIRNHCKLEK